jgi:hypothetical protein
MGRRRRSCSRLSGPDGHGGRAIGPRFDHPVGCLWAAAGNARADTGPLGRAQKGSATSSVEQRPHGRGHDPGAVRDRSRGAAINRWQPVAGAPAEPAGPDAEPACTDPDALPANPAQRAATAGPDADSTPLRALARSYPEP